MSTPTTGTIARIQIVLLSALPNPSVLLPNGGEILTGSMTTISWSATDPDGDALSFCVLFSPDSGATWKTLTTDHNTTSFAVPLNALGQTRFGLIRVQASDGFNTRDDVSDATFTTPNIPPEVQILRPFHLDHFAGVQLVIFEASSFDVEDSVLAGSNLNWTSNIDGFLGSGATVELLASSLSENNHTITLTGSDSGGARATATVNISVYRIAPPVPIPEETAAPVSSSPISPAPIPSPPTKSPVAECRIGLFNLLCFVRNIFQWLIDLIFFWRRD